MKHETGNCEDVSAAILNGGKARRMHGVDKARLTVAGETLVRRQLAVLAPRFSAIAMVGEDAERADGLPLASLRDRVGGLGPLDGIAGALAWSPTPWLLAVACDMPEVRGAVVDVLLAARRPQTDIVAFAANGRAQPLLALYHRRLLPTLDALLAERALRASDLLLTPPKGVTVRLLSDADLPDSDQEGQSFHNLNRPEDLPQS